MFERILVPLDGSELAESVLHQVARLLRRKDAEVLLLRVVTLPPAVEGDVGTPLEALWSRATEYIQAMEQRLSAQGSRVRAKVVEGFAADQILEVAKNEHATMIAMSTHGRTGLARWVFGSVAEKVLRASPIPVLAVPSFTGSGGDAFPTGARELPFRKILVPIAAADLSLEIVPAVIEFAQLFESRIFALNVCDGPECAVPVHQMRQAYEQLRAAAVAAEPVVKQGNAALQILETCRETGADLIAMTTHGHSGLSRWVLGSVAEKVLRAANVPLLVLRTSGVSSPLAPRVPSLAPGLSLIPGPD
jgi:nucleotide-binding universal stress UspA family protein